MFKATNDHARVNAQQHREDVTLSELKKQLGFAGGRRAAGADGADGTGYSEATIEAFLLRFLKAKRLSTSEAVAKLKRRRAFEATLPTISITPAVISALRSGAISLLGNDFRGRPILFLNLKDFSLPPIEVDEAQRILIVLLEFMQAKCMAANETACAGGGEGARSTSVSGRTGAGAGPGSRQGSGYGGTTAEATPKAPPPQSFVFLINEDGAPWAVHVPLLRKAAALYAIYAKYYPGLIDLVLIAEAAFEVRQGVQAALAGSSSETGRAIMMVQRSDLPRYMAEEVLPTCLGGRLQTNGNALGFAEAVLRHWYTVTSFLQLENNSASAVAGEGSGDVGAGKDGARKTTAARPLYLPTPLIRSSAQFVSLHRAAVMVAADGALRGKDWKGSLAGETTDAAGRHQSTSLLSIFGAGGAAPHRPPTAAALGDRDGSTLLTASHRLGGGALEDGVCSELSMDDVTLDVGEASRLVGNGQQPQPPERSHGAGPPVARPLEGEESAKIRADPDYAVSIVEKERGLRIQAEQRLKIAQLGVSLDPRNISTVEKQLASIHHELNVLVADVVVRARAAREKGSEATVSQLLDLTLTALETAGALPEEVPAMSMATPQQREPKNSTCCTVM